MAILADQEGQPVGLTRFVGVDQQAGNGASGAPEVRMVMALLANGIRLVCHHCGLSPQRQHERQLFEYTPFYSSGGSRGREGTAAQATRSSACPSRPCSSARRRTTSP